MDQFHLTIPQPADKIQAEYIWIGGSGQDLRGKTKTLTVAGPGKEVTLADLPIWNFDGSSTGQAPGDNSEILLRPCAIFKDPFRQGNNILVLCDCLDADMQVIPSNTRAPANEIFSRKEVAEAEPWFGLEQEYTLYKNGRILGWPEDPKGYPAPQGPYYCGVGTDAAYGRQIVEAHYRACLYAGLKIAGINAEVMAGQWEFQIGPCTGIEEGDHLWMARYLLHRVCELYGCTASVEPKPMLGDWNGSGCHTNFSTKPMREDGGYEKIIEAVERLGPKHALHISKYGEGNDKRLTGAHETASIDEFSYGVADRGSSVRIPRQTKIDGKGYFEDRRPASNIDPYVVTSLLTHTSMGLED